MSEVAWLAFTLALTTTWALPGPSVCASRAVAAAAVVESYCWSADCCEVPAPPALLGARRRPQQRAGRVGDRDLLVGQALDARGDELGDALDRVRVERAGVGQQHRGARALAVVAEQLVLLVGEDEVDGGGVDALDLLDRLVELALERALVGDLLLEVRGAELRAVEQLEAGLGAADSEQAGRRQRDPRLARLARVDGERGAAVLDLVADALRGQRALDLARLRRVEAGEQRRVARRGSEVHDHDEEHDRGGERAADHGPTLGRELSDELTNVHLQRWWGLHLGLEDGVDGVGELGADLRGEVHRQRRVLDRGDRLRRVGQLAGGELLRRRGGVGLARLERVDRARRARSRSCRRCRRWRSCRRPGSGRAEPTPPTLHSLGPSGPTAPEIAGIISGDPGSSRTSSSRWSSRSHRTRRTATRRSCRPSRSPS